MNQMTLVKLCRVGILLPLLVLILSLRVQSQGKPIENALLWKVTGNCLLKPSFLFGTIHLQDRRVFNFNDSLYSFIQSADGFAMEIHPDSVVSALMQKADGNNSGNLLRKHLSKPGARHDDMPTFVDAYLYGVARNQGKEIAGLEKASDQLRMLDKIKGNVDVKQLLKGMKKERNITERLVQLYMKENLQGIHQLMSYLPQETEDNLLNLRNHVMVLKMDSLIQAKSYVVAVGTAHLPGKQGMIELLRQKGYRVEPVFTTSRTHASNYAIKAAQTTAWTDVQEPQHGYTVRMPGKPSLVDMLNGNMNMNMYMDIASMKLYYAAFVVPTINVTKQNVDSILQAMCKTSMAPSKGEAISRRRFTKGKFEVIDFAYRQATDKMFARVQAIAMGKRTYLVGFSSPRRDDVTSPEVDTFFDSFTLVDMPRHEWETQTFPAHYFRVALPVKATVIDLPVNDSSVSSVQFNSIDNNTGAYFGLTVLTVAPGFYIRADSVYFSDELLRLHETMKLYDLQQQDTAFEGFPARKIEARLKDGRMLNCFMISRGTRVYNLTAITTSEDSADANVGLFFKSFSFIDYPKLVWKAVVLTGPGITVASPGTFSKIEYLDEKNDSAASGREFKWFTYDSATATAFYVMRKKLSPYLWVKHDSLLLKRKMYDMLDVRDVVTGYKFLRHGSNSGIEFNIKTPGSSFTAKNEATS